jgi:hypothetical protein
MMKLGLILLVSLVASVAVPAQISSVYTSTKTSACRTISSNPDEGGSYEGECRGVGGYKVRLHEGDLRQSLDIISPTKKKSELNLWQSFSSFSAVGEKLEWRTKAGVPFALIFRYYVADPQGGKGSQYLFVTKLGKSSSCVVDIVDPMQNQNEKAREIADNSAGKPCKTNQ